MSCDMVLLLLPLVWRIDEGTLVCCDVHCVQCVQCVHSDYNNKSMLHLIDLNNCSDPFANHTKYHSFSLYRLFSMSLLLSLHSYTQPFSMVALFMKTFSKLFPTHIYWLNKVVVFMYMLFLELVAFYFDCGRSYFFWIILWTVFFHSFIYLFNMYSKQSATNFNYAINYLQIIYTPERRLYRKSVFGCLTLDMFTPINVTYQLINKRKSLDTN